MKNITMNIIVTEGTGDGLTNLSAYDKALCQAGIGNYNLIRLSSVIPPNTAVCTKKYTPCEDEYGNRLYIVESSCIETIIGKEAWAGLGWITQNNDSGRGLFVEHYGSSEQEVKTLIEKSLESMKTYREEEHGDIYIKTTGITCKDKPVCALVAAVYKSEPW